MTLLKKDLLSHVHQMSFFKNPFMKYISKIMKFNLMIKVENLRRREHF